MLRFRDLCGLVIRNRRFPLLSWFDDPTHKRLFNAAKLCRALVEAGVKEIVVQRFVPWLGSERLVYMCARRPARPPNILGKLAHEAVAEFGWRSVGPRSGKTLTDVEAYDETWSTRQYGSELGLRTGDGTRKPNSTPPPYLN